jgi:hypothetical protein
MAAAVVSSYPSNLYHQPSYLNSNLIAYYVAQYLRNQYYKSKPQKQQTQPRTPTPTKTTEPIDSTVQQLRPRREPRIHRQVILLPTPEPIYRQVRHRLPTPERQVIQRTVIQKANGDVIVQQERQRKKTRSQSRSKTTPQTRSPRSPQDKTD